MTIRWVWPKVGLWLVLAVPLVLIGFDIAQELEQPGSALGTDPEDALTDQLGEWTLRILLLTLAVSPVARLVRRRQLIRYRRMIGLWAFAYAVLHFTVYFGLLAGLDVDAVVADFSKRPYITVGIAALVLLVPLAVTSTRGWQRRLRSRWRQLHRLVYPIAVLAIVHLSWLAKGGIMEPVIYASILALLLGERIVDTLRRRRPAVQAAGSEAGENVGE